jgi:hypothetical protein
MFHVKRSRGCAPRRWPGAREVRGADVQDLGLRPSCNRQPGLFAVPCWFHCGRSGSPRRRRPRRPGRFAGDLGPGCVRSVGPRPRSSPGLSAVVSRETCLLDLARRRGHERPSTPGLSTEGRPLSWVRRWTRRPRTKNDADGAVLADPVSGDQDRVRRSPSAQGTGEVGALGGQTSRTPRSRRICRPCSRGAQSELRDTAGDAGARAGDPKS